MQSRVLGSKLSLLYQMLAATFIVACDLNANTEGATSKSPLPSCNLEEYSSRIIGVEIVVSRKQLKLSVDSE